MKKSITIKKTVTFLYFMTAIIFVLCGYRNLLHDNIYHNPGKQLNVMLNCYIVQTWLGKRLSSTFCSHQRMFMHHLSTYTQLV